jgi:hypothetical protein
MSRLCSVHLSDFVLPFPERDGPHLSDRDMLKAVTADAGLISPATGAPRTQTSTLYH